MSYDWKCLELAQAFLDDIDDLPPHSRPDSEDELAQIIQNAIEDFLTILKEGSP